MLTPVILTASFRKADGTYAGGYLIATLSEPIVNGTEEVDTTPLRGQLNAEGELVNMRGDPFILVANEDPGTEPVGTAYEITLQLDGEAVRSFWIKVPTPLPPGEGEEPKPATIDLAELETP
jgi:hypothetical protein